MIDKEKRCNNCGETFPATKEYFYMRRNPSGEMSARSYCKLCYRADMIKCWDAHRGERLDYAKAYRNKNKELIKQKRIERARKDMQ